MSHLVETEWLVERLGDPDLRIVDMRGHLKWEQRGERQPWESALADYQQAHVPGAVYLDFTRDLVDLNDPVPLQVAPLSKLQSVLSEKGIGDQHTVVAYDADRSIFATRLWWIFRLCGHRNLRVLNGGWPKWLREGRPVSKEVPRHRKAKFSGRVEPRWRIDLQALLGQLHGSAVIVDARSAEDYSGNPKWATRGGHIPGARNLPASSLLQADGTFRPLAELRAMAQSCVQQERTAVTYCGLGLAATAVAFVLDMLGYRDIRVFDGSWAEWGSRVDLPAA